MSEDPQADREKPEPPRTAMPQPLKLFRSEELFGGERLICIEHAGAVYRLQITSRGKLILQK